MRNSIRAMRIVADLTLAEAAYKLQVDANTLLAWENDPSLLPDLPFIVQDRLSHLYKMSGDEIAILFAQEKEHMIRANPEPTAGMPISQLPAPPAPSQRGEFPLTCGASITLIVPVPLLALTTHERRIIARVLALLEDDLTALQGH